MWISGIPSMVRRALPDPARRPVIRRAHGAVGLATLLTLTGTGVVASTPQPGRPVVESRATDLAGRLEAVGRTVTVQPDLPTTQAVGFEWSGATEGAVEVRAQEGGRWGPWLRLEGDPTEGPDLDSKEYRGRTTAGPVWVGATGRLEVRVAEGVLPDLRLHAIRSEPGRAPAATLRPAGALPATPTVVTRAQWGADESWRKVAPGCNGNPEYAQRVRFAVVHHTATSNDYKPEEAPALLRAMYQFHTHVNKWCDLGYNFVVDRFGTVYEGRAGGTTLPVLGAHAAGFNAGSTGAAFLGTFSTAELPSAAYGGMRRLLAWKLALHGVNADRQINVVAGSNPGGKHPPGSSVPVWGISTHRELNATSCPGDAAQGRMAELRTDVQTDMRTFTAYGSFKGGVRLARGDVDGDKTLETIIGPGPGGGPHVRVIRVDGSAAADFFAYAPGFGGGVDVAACDVNGDGKAEIVTGAGAGGGPHVRVLRSDGSEVAGFFAYDPGFRGGVSVACGDLDGDGKAEIVTGAGAGGGPHVRIFRVESGLLGSFVTPLGGFFAYDPAFTGGIDVAVGDLDGDGKAEIVTGAGAGGGPHVRAFRPDGTEVTGFFAYDSRFRGGVRVSTGLIDGDAAADLITGAGTSGGPHVRARRLDGTSLASYLALSPTFTGGVDVAGAREGITAGMLSGGSTVMLAPFPVGGP